MGERNGVSHWTNMRDGFAAIRELMIVLLILAFLLMPQRIQKFLHDAGVRSVAGVEFDWQKFKNAQAQIDLAKSDMQEVQIQLNTVSTLLGQLQNSEPPAARSLPSMSALSENLDDSPRTVDVDRLMRSLETAQSKSQEIDQRLQRAQQYSHDILTNPVLTPPEQLFGKQQQ